MSQVFAFQSLPIRAHIENENIWFVAKDVCAVLGITWSGATMKSIPNQWRTMLSFNIVGKCRRVVCISEPAVYKLAFRSNKPEADAFTNWVASEVLPVIRKTGKYETPSIQKALPEPEASSTRSNVTLDAEAARYFAKKYPHMADVFTKHTKPATKPTSGYYYQDAEIDLHFRKLRKLSKEFSDEEVAISRILYEKQGDILSNLSPRRSIYLHMNTALERSFYALNNILDAAEAHAKSMCAMSEM